MTIMNPVGYKFKLAKNVVPSELRILRPAIVIGFFLFLLLLLSITSTKPIFSFPDKKFLLSTFQARTSPTSEDHKSELSENFQLPTLVARTNSVSEDHNSELSAREVSKTGGTLTCDNSGTRSIVCEMKGDVRIHANSSSILLVQSSPTVASERNESVQIKPYARKRDANAMRQVREVVLKSSKDGHDPPHCNINHSTPAIVFSAGGYAGNLFHDYVDILLPLFLTSHQYSREVQFLITDSQPRWISRHQQVLTELSHYEIIDFNTDNSVHCYQHVTVGLRNHDIFYINPKLPPIGYSLANFTQFMRSAYSLERETVTKIEADADRKPKLLIISRKWSRSFTNIDQIVRMAEEIGYIVVIKEPNGKTDVAELAHLVNSCDVMTGVHGAGLSNFVFLPMNATLIQIVPWGKLGGLAWYTFGSAATNAHLRYVQYEIGVEESTLIEKYPRDNPIISDPQLVHKSGWDTVRVEFLVKQNVKLDVVKFRPVLLNAFNMIHG